MAFTLTAPSDPPPLARFAKGRDGGAAVPVPNVRYGKLMTAVLERGEPFRVVVPGTSMSPFIHDGDVITLVSAPARIRLGDVVAFVDPRCVKVTVHRVVGKEPGAYRIRGDNLSAEDGVIAKCHVIGRVTRVERAGRNVRLGIGIERIAIALLSRRGWLSPVIANLWPVVRPLVRTFTHR